MAEPETDAQKISRAALSGLRRQIVLSQWAIFAERFARCFWPAISLALFFYGLLRWGLFADLGQTPLLAVTAGFVAGFLYLLTRGAGKFQLPDRDAAVDRLDARLDGRPVASLGDQQVIGTGDAASEQVWAMHLARMAKAARAARASEPRPHLSRRDPWALRLLALLVFVSAIAFNWGKSGQSLLDGLQGIPDSAMASGPSFEAWVEPPIYTGKPTIYLNSYPNGKPLELPVGSRVVLRVYGGATDNTLQETISHSGDSALPQSEAEMEETEFSVARDGMLAIAPRGGERHSWPVQVIPDLAPEVELTGDITRSLQGSMQIPYQASDDYGVEGGSVEVRLRLADVERRHGLAATPEPRPPVAFDIEMPLRGDTRQIEEVLVEELARHPWAGLPVTISLNVFDAYQNVGAIEPVLVPMPGKRFFDPVASALAEQRRDLLWSRTNAERVRMILKAVTTRPDGFFPNDKAYLMTRSAIRRLDYNSEPALSATIRDEVAELLWQAALLIEDGDLADAAERLRRAQERLSEAMRNGATDEEIQQLMDELRRATQDYIRQLAENAERNPNQQQSAADPSQTMNQDQLQQLMDRIQELMEQGRMDEAQQLLQMLQQMLENMQIVQGGSGQPGDQLREGMQDTLRQQQDLADETFRQMQEEFNRQRREGQPDSGRPSQPQELGEAPDSGQLPGQGLSPEDLADRQEALRQLLEGQRGQLPQDGSDPGRAGLEALEQAERQMGQARDNLEEGDLSGALDEQAEAIDSLREGLRSIDEAARQAERQNGQPSGQGNGPAVGQAARDPLGRPLGGNGTPSSNERIVPDEEIYRKSRELRDEIRRRSGEQERPQIELDYLKRLLERF